MNCHTNYSYCRFLFLIANYMLVAEGYEEYDYSILDELSGYGSPFGGFSRATASRLAKVPLLLPEILDDDVQDEDTASSSFYTVTDNSGQTYACGVYSQDELLEWTTSGVFEPPVFNHHPATTTSNRNKDAHIMTEDQPLVDSKLILSAPHDIEATLTTSLAGVCGQLHLGWWSYEWCHEGRVSQFHLAVDSKNGQVSIESVTKLGAFAKRIVYSQEEDWSTLRSYRNGWVGEEQVQLAVVVDEYTLDGDLCPSTEEEEKGVAETNRRAFVHLQCCAPKVLEAKNRRGLLHRNGQVVVSGDAVVMHLEEDPVCNYNITICTPLLCQDPSTQVATTTSSSSLTSSGDETIQQILNRALTNYCIQTDTGEWWTYELCHGKKVRQYHEAIGTRKTEGGSVDITRTIEAEHLLGVFDSSMVKDGEDWELVVNATESGSSKGMPTGGNGAYYEVEYTGGDVCDHSDVTDAAVIAGNIGAGGVERAASVRYYCGSKYAISVNEDSTCHYVVDVYVPDLCQHKLFVAPVGKMQIVKCLPINS